MHAALGLEAPLEPLDASKYLFAARDVVLHKVCIIHVKIFKLWWDVFAFISVLPDMYTQ